MTKEKPGLHKRNRHREGYDFTRLIAGFPGLASFVYSIHNRESIDFSNPKAVKALNKALLKCDYNIEWDIPDNYLCPPIPGRADYIHYLADLIVEEGDIPRGEDVCILDIGVGANCIYPLIGYKEYGWHFIGTDSNQVALASAESIIKTNALSHAIELRWQKSPEKIFDGILKATDKFTAVMCNPPFHSSLKDAEKGTLRKWKNLKIPTKALNFGGVSPELYCEGGELGFIGKIIKESIEIQKQVTWFTTLVSKKEHLPDILLHLEQANPSQFKIIEMAQGQKKSRIMAWRF